MNDQYYGILGIAHLKENPQEVVDELVNEFTEVIDEDLEITLSRIKFPVNVEIFERRKIDKRDIDKYADNILDYLFEMLGGDYGTPDGVPPEPDKPEYDAAKTFIKTVADKYTTYTFSPSGKHITYTKQDIRNLYQKSEQSEDEQSLMKTIQASRYDGLVYSFNLPPGWTKQDARSSADKMTPHYIVTYIDEGPIGNISLVGRHQDTGDVDFRIFLINAAPAPHQ